MDNPLFALLVFGILVANTALLWRLRTNEAFLQEYVRTSPKAWIWRKLFGPDRAAEIIRTRMVPLGMAIWGAVLVAFGASALLE